jgi:hypothetical protein
VSGSGELGGGEVDVVGEPPVEGFVGRRGKIWRWCSNVAGEVETVVDVVAVELFVLQVAEPAFAYPVGAG